MPNLMTTVTIAAVMITVATIVVLIPEMMLWIGGAGIIGHGRCSFRFAGGGNRNRKGRPAKGALSAG